MSLRLHAASSTFHQEDPWIRVVVVLNGGADKFVWRNVNCHILYLDLDPSLVIRWVYLFTSEISPNKNVIDYFFLSTYPIHDLPIASRSWLQSSLDTFHTIEGVR